jgi:hypothetical protein
LNFDSPKQWNENEDDWEEQIQWVLEKITQPFFHASLHPNLAGFSVLWNQLVRVFFSGYVIGVVCEEAKDVTDKLISKFDHPQFAIRHLYRIFAVPQWKHDYSLNDLSPFEEKMQAFVEDIDQHINDDQSIDLTELFLSLQREEAEEALFDRFWNDYGERLYLGFLLLLEKLQTRGYEVDEKLYWSIIEGVLREEIRRLL